MKNLKNKEPKIRKFSSAKKWRDWLEKNHELAEGLWLQLYKKDSGKKTVTHAEALDEALCFGWIDGQGKKYDEQSWIIKFTPRRPRSIWSKRNRQHIERLIKENKMTKHGLKEVEKAKADGRWQSAYDSQKDMKVPLDFIRELKKDKGAYNFFKTLNKSNIYAIAWRLQTAKKLETRARRMEVLLAKMKKQEKLH